MYHEEIEVDTEVEDEVEEDLDMAEVQWCVTTSNNQEIMKGNSHFHLRHVCIVAQ
jgi:hypothetical protein